MAQRPNNYLQLSNIRTLIILVQASKATYVFERNIFIKVCKTNFLYFLYFIRLADNILEFWFVHSWGSGTKLVSTVGAATLNWFLVGAAAQNCFLQLINR